MNSSRRMLTRRRFLRGTGAALLALPFLEYFHPFRSFAVGEGCKRPRLLVYYFPNGRRPEWWVPNPTGYGLIFSEQSAALQPFAGRLLSMVGLDNIAARESPGAAHAMGTGTIMTGTRIPDLVGLKNGISLDQILARELDLTTRFQSLQFSAGEPGPCDVGGASCAYTQSVSWAGYGMPLIPTIDPLIAFDRLFRNGSDGLTGAAGEVRARSIGSVLDFVNEDARALSSRLGKDDKARLEEYLTAVGDLERSLSAGQATCTVPAMGPAGGLSYPERVNAFHQLIKLAFQCDETRIISFMIEFGLSGRSHDFIGAPGGHHALSHYGNSTDYESLKTVETWHAQRLADMLQLLTDTPGVEGGASLLDETIVLAISSMGAGSNHDHANNCPLLFGGTGFINATNQQLALPGTPLANLHVSLLKVFGVTGQFGSGGAIFGDYGTSEIAGVAAAACG
jgi:hypothetical protein